LEDLILFGHNEKSSILLIFFFNAMLFSYLLLKKGLEEGKRDPLWLAVFIFLGGLYICPFMLGYAGWYSVKSYREFMFFVPFQQLFLIGPIFFFYIKTLLNKDFQLTREDAIHFVPAALYLIYSLTVFVVDKLLLDEFYFYADGKDKDLDFWYQMAGLISMLYYLFRSLQYYRNYRKRSVQEVSYADEIAFKWIKYFAMAFSLILILRVLHFIINPEWGNFGRKYWYYLCFSILLLYISITGYSNTTKVTLNLGANRLDPITPLEPSVPKVQTETSTEPEEEEILDLQEWKEKITHLFDAENIYQNPSLTLTDLANLLTTNRNIISKAINQEFKMNFNDLVNQKRVEAVINKLKKGDHIRNTLLSIALDCGFNSKTTFNRAFKKHTTLTPKQYISKYEL